MPSHLHELPSTDGCSDAMLWHTIKLFIHTRSPDLCWRGGPSGLKELFFVFYWYNVHES